MSSATDLRLELTCDDEPVIYCADCWAREFGGVVKLSGRLVARAARVTDRRGRVLRLYFSTSGVDFFVGAVGVDPRLLCAPVTQRYVCVLVMVSSPAPAEKPMTVTVAA